MPSASELGRKHSKTTERTFTVDGKFLRDEAREAIRSYFMPFAGVYAAAVGKEVRVVGSADLKAEGTRPAKGHRGASSERKNRQR